MNREKMGNRLTEAPHLDMDPYLTRVLDAIAEGVVVQGADQQVAYMNQAAQSMLRVSPEQLARADGEAVFPEYTTLDGVALPEGERPFDRVRQSLETITEAEYILVWPDGSRLFTSANSSPLRDTDGAFAGVLYTFRDVTKRYNLEQELRRSNAELEQFAYVASHDLQEPLRMVSSYVQLLARRYRGKLGEDADDFIGYAVDGAQRMQALINDLLAFSRINTDERPFANTDLSQVLKHVLTSLQPLIEETGTTVHHEALPEVIAIHGQLEQLLQNLIGNAIKYRRPDEPPVLDLTCEDRGETWLFSLRDNGIGIAAEYHDRVFMIFQRLHNRDEYSGTGIGLAICRRIVELHGGEIWIESSVGAGTVVHFTLEKGEMGSNG